MPLQNRVDPFGNLCAVPARGTAMGNRGMLHDDDQNVVHYHRHKNWVICRLHVQDRWGEAVQRQIMQPGRYTELFFLDEATALAAGHRPCGRCAPERYAEFVRRFKQANADYPGRIDDVLHSERFIPHRSRWPAKKKTYQANINTLPAGTFVLLDDDPASTPHLLLDEALTPWQFAGYGELLPRSSDQTVTVLTPPSTVRTLSAGYQPAIYPTKY